MSRVVISCYGHEDNPRYRAGEAIVVREIARFLSCKHEVVVISGSYPRCHSEPFQRFYLPTGCAWPRTGLLQFHLLLARAARRITHDLWIESAPLVSAGFIPLVTSRPVIALVQALTAEDMTRRYKTPVGFFERRRLARYKRFIVLNETDRELVTGGRHDVSCAAIPNGVELPDEPPPAGEGHHILFLGRIDVNQKGLDLLLAAIDAAKPRLPVLLAGAGRRAEESRLVRLTRADHRTSDAGRARVRPRQGGAAAGLRLRGAAVPVRELRPVRPRGDGLGKPVVHFDLPRCSGWETMRRPASRPSMSTPSRLRSAGWPPMAPSGRAWGKPRGKPPNGIPGPRSATVT